ncbi:GumC family protein [Halpernia frigidisoli]|uniref:non-specific protein-tyrosine kinase n=1 Tax=Halpernia frigidisoli TaxID=1125876 RepID=A0A1I3FFQ7_9FLAO|nr:tyrosine-protein kinase [Halpernia frigidisoli]SFI09751.1 capsular exopolysaccharide family [Halpernia frigidisoli]
MELLENAVPESRAISINLKKELGRYVKKWPWFLLTMLIFYTVAKIYLRYAQPQYFTTTTLKLQESKAQNAALSDLKNLGMGVSGDEELQGETTIIVSKPILEKVVKNLNLDVTFFSKGSIKEVELYDDSPILGKILNLKNPVGFGGASFFVKPLNGKSFILAGENGGAQKQYDFGKPFQLDFGTVQFDLKPYSEFSGPIKVLFSNSANVAGNLEGRISVSLPQNKGLLMQVDLTGPVPHKSENILNNLAKEYIVDGINDKNIEARNTQNFINDRLDIISGDLSGIETEKEGFKRNNQITDLEAQATLALSNADADTKAAFGYNTQLNLINSIYNSTGGEQLLPSNMGLPASLDALITQYNNLLLSKNRLSKQATSLNPEVVEMSKQIASVKNLIRKNLIESRENLMVQLGQTKGQINVAKDNLNKYPTREKVFRSIERQQTLKEQLYLYLLQKREENAITLAVTAPKAKIINPAFTTGIVKPNYSQITNGALLMGFLLPLVLFLGFNFLDSKIHNKNNILSLIPDAVVIGEIPVNKEKTPKVHDNDFSVFAESYRILVSNLRFFLRAKNINSGGVILITSSIKGEGKTTVSMNTALTLAGKSKVIIIGADIRNPQLHRFIEGENFGLTDYLISENENFESYIRKSNLSTNLDVMFSGQIAPNPNDLLDMKKFDDLIISLKEKYDYVVLDSAPVMLVSDTLSLIANSDVILYVIKSAFTEKEMLSFAGDFKKENQIKSLVFVLNAVKPQDTKFGTKYGYGYYSYYSNSKKKWWKNWI